MYNSIIFTDVTDNIRADKALGAYKVAQVLRENGYSCLVVDHLHIFDKNELFDIIDLALGATTYLVGFSNTFFADSNVTKNADGSTPHFKYPLENRVFPQGPDFENEVIEYIRKKNPKTKTALGGNGWTSTNGRNKNIDYQILGYAEVSMVNLMDHLSKGAPLNNSHKNLWGVTIVDDRTAKGYNFQNSRMDWQYADVLNQTVLPLEVARGCIFKCKFCAFPMNGKQNLDFVRDPKIMAYELEKNYEEYGITTYNIVDDTFNDSNEKIDQILKEFKKLKFQPEFWAYTRLDLICRDLDTNIDKLYDIGIRGTHFGIETLNKRTGLIVGKGYSKKKQIEAVQRIRHRYGNKFSMNASFIFGLPEESEKSMFDTNELLLSGELPLHTWKFFPMHIMKKDRAAWHSDIAMNYESYGYKEIAVVDEDSFIKWENKHTNFYRVEEFARTFTEQGIQSDLYHIPNIIGWSIMPLGYSLEYLTTTIYKDIDWHEIENRKIKFSQEYKVKLFSYLEQQSSMPERSH